MKTNYLAAILALSVLGTGCSKKTSPVVAHPVSTYEVDPCMEFHPELNTFVDKNGEPTRLNLIRSEDEMKKLEIECKKKFEAEAKAKTTQ